MSREFIPRRSFVLAGLAGQVDGALARLWPWPGDLVVEDKKPGKPEPTISESTPQERLEEVLPQLLSTKEPDEERGLFLQLPSVDEKQHALFAVMDPLLRAETFYKIWGSRERLPGLPLTEKVMKICDYFSYIKGFNHLVSINGVSEEMATMVGVGIPYETMHQSILASETFAQGRELESWQTVSPVFIAAIAQIETHGGVKLGSIPINRRVGGIYRRMYEEYLNEVRGPMNIDISNKWDLTKLLGSVGGAMGVPQIVANTFDNTWGKKDGSRLNPFDLFEGCQIIAQILVSKGWSNKSQRACYIAFDSYGAGAYSRLFWDIWNVAKSF